MRMTTAFSEQLSEQWLLERTYHAHLHSGKELSVPEFTEAMKKVSNFYVPVSTWQEISQEEAYDSYEQGTPVLLYGEHSWQHLKGASGAWRPNKNMRAIIYGNTWEQPESVSGIEYAVCYQNPKRGRFSNEPWRTWFSSETDLLFDGGVRSAITFLVPSTQFPFTTHYTVVTSDGHVSEYPGRVEAIEGFQASPPLELSYGIQGQTVLFPHFCYYHEVLCPSGVYRLEFFGPRMDEPGYRVAEVALV